MDILIEVTIFDGETGEIERKIIKTFDCRYAYEVEEKFEQLGRKVAVIIDPNE